MVFFNAVTHEPFEVSSCNVYGSKIWRYGQILGHILKWLHSNALCCVAGDSTSLIF